MIRQVEFLVNVPLHSSVNGFKFSSEVQLGLMVRLLSINFSTFPLFIFRPHFVPQACIMYLDFPLSYVSPLARNHFPLGTF